MTAAMHETPLSRVLAKLPGYKKNGKGYVARCPAHPDRSPSLSVGVGKDGRVLLTCHTGCTLDDIVASMGLAMTDIFPASPYRITPPQPLKHDRPVRVALYDYTDACGALLYKVNRFEPGLEGGDKSFVPEHPDGTKGYPDGPRVLYKLPQVLDAIENGRTVYLVEGEKCAEFLMDEGYTATCHAGGSKAWRDEYAIPFKSADVVILLDNDDTGKSWGEQAAAAITNAGAASVRLVSLPGLTKPKEDIVEWLTVYDHTLDDLQELVGETRLWTPDPSNRTRWRLDEILANDEIMRPPPPIVPYIAWSGRSTLLAAGEKLGKSTLIGYTAAAVTKGESFLGEPTSGGTVLIVGLEEAMGDAARRLRHFNAAATRLYYVNKLPGNPQERLDALRAHIEAVSPVLVIVDTLIAYGDTSVTDWASSAQAAPIVNALTSIAHETGVAVVLVHHAKKSDGKYRDSSAIGGAVDVIAEMQAPDVEKDPTLRKLNVRGRLGMYFAQFRFDGDTYVIDRGDEAPLDYRVREFVRNKVKCSVRDVIEGVRGKAETIRTCILQMLADGRLQNLTPDRQHATLMAPDTQQGRMTWDT